MLRIDFANRALDELHTRLDDVRIRKPDGVGSRSPEHHVELREPEHERVALIDQNELDLVSELLRQPGRQLEAPEPGAEHDHVGVNGRRGYAVQIRNVGYVVPGVVRHRAAPPRILSADCTGRLGRSDS